MSHSGYQKIIDVVQLSAKLLTTTMEGGFMKSYRIIIATAALATTGTLTGLSLTGAQAAARPVSAPMRSVELPAIPVPPVAPASAPAQPPAAPPATPLVPPSSVSAPAPASVHAQPAATVATTTTTTVPVAQPGPQPQGPSTTVEVTDCQVTWTITMTNPDPLPQDSATYQLTQGFEGSCADAAAAAAAHPGAVVTQVTDPVTTTPGEVLPPA